MVGGWVKWSRSLPRQPAINIHLDFHDHSSEPTTTNKIRGEAPSYDEGLPPVVSFADQDLVDPLIPPMSAMYAMQPI